MINPEFDGRGDKMRCFKMMMIFFVIIISVLCPVVAKASPFVVVNIKGEIDAGHTALIQRAVNNARTIGSQAILVEIDTFGGRVDSAVKIRDVIIESPLTTICYIKNRAWSAGALIAIAHKQIAMAPGGSIGAAEPIPATEKNIAALKAEFAATANKTGRNAQIAEAMVDKTLGFPGVAQPGQIIALADYRAVKLGYADLVADQRSQILRYYGLEDNDIVEYNLTWRDTLSGWLTETSTKSLLITIITLAILTEIKTAGLGIAAFFGLLAAALFFVSQWWIGFASWPEVTLFLVGILMFFIELFTTGTGFFGAAGLCAILLSIFLALGTTANALLILASSITMAVVIFLLIINHLPKSELWKKVVLKESETSDAGFVSSKNYEIYLAKEGIAVTPLRPAGIVSIDGVQLNVISEGQFIMAGSRVKVVSVSGNRIIVQLILNIKEVD